MAGSKRVLKTAAVTALACALVVVAFSGWIVYMGGYWENSPWFSRISGPRRFRQFVADPIPVEIYDLRGGYSGFPQGFVKTEFRFTGDFARLAFLKDWKQLESGPAILGMSAKDCRTFKFKSPAEERYLVIDENRDRGYLYVP